MGSRNTIFDLAQTFGVSEFSIIKAKRQVVQAILTNLIHRTIEWPSDNEFVTIANDFNNFRLNNFPNIIGALDSTHIPISTPLNTPDVYFNRKKFHSIVL